MCEAMEQGFEELYGDRLRKEAAEIAAKIVAQNQKDILCLIKRIREESKKGTAKEEICKNFNVDELFVDFCLSL